MGTPGKGIITTDGKRAGLIASGKGAIVQAGGTCCDCPGEPECCIPAIYACICGQSKVLLPDGPHQTWGVGACCDCDGSPTIEAWITCEEDVITLHWEYECGATTDDGTVDLSELCDGETIIEDVISVAGCTFNDYFSPNIEDMEFCCTEGCITGFEETGPPTPISDCSSEPNPDAPASADGQVDFISLERAAGSGICTGEEITFANAWSSGRDPETTTDYHFTFAFPECIGFELISAEMQYESDPVVTGSATWTGNTLEIDFENVGALNEGTTDVEIVFRILGCCCETEDVPITLSGSCPLAAEFWECTLYGCTDT